MWTGLSWYFIVVILVGWWNCNRQWSKENANLLKRIEDYELTKTMDRAFYHCKSPVRISCAECKNFFFVASGEEFDPPYCAYCGCRFQGTNFISKRDADGNWAYYDLEGNEIDAPEGREDGLDTG